MLEDQKRSRDVDLVSPRRVEWLTIQAAGRRGLPAMCPDYFPMCSKAKADHSYDEAVEQI